MGIGIGWPNVTSGGVAPPTVYKYEINNCGGLQGEVYSASPVFQAGITLYNDSALTEPIESATFGDPFNEFPNEPSPGYKSNDLGFIISSDTTCP